MQDNIYGTDVTDWLDQVRAQPKHLVVLRPSLDAIAERERARNLATGKTAYRPGEDGWTIQLLDEALGRTPRLELCLDTTTQTPEESVDEILLRHDEARVT